MISEKLYRETTKKYKGLELGKGHNFYDEWRRIPTKERKESKRARELVEMSKKYYAQFR
jgi:hypothetical protein